MSPITAPGVIGVTTVDVTVAYRHKGSSGGPLDNISAYINAYFATEQVHQHRDPAGVAHALNQAQTLVEGRPENTNGIALDEQWLLLNADEALARIVPQSDQARSFNSSCSQIRTQIRHGRQIGEMIFLLSRCPLFADEPGFVPRKILLTHVLDTLMWSVGSPHAHLWRAHKIGKLG